MITAKYELDSVDRFHTGFMAAARFDIAACDVEDRPLLANLDDIGLRSVAPALSALGVERLADVEELSDHHRQSVGIRQTPGRRALSLQVASSSSKETDRRWSTSSPAWVACSTG